MTVKSPEKQFELPVSAMRQIVGSFRSEMEGGLAGKNSPLKMIPTYVEMPTGKEKGRYIALDLGGTNFRVLELTLKGNRKIGRPGMMKFVLGKGHITGSAEVFFDFIAASVKIFLKKQKVSAASPLDLGFTFSFPIRQTGVASGVLIEWTKGFNVKGVVGRDVVGLMREAFKRKGIGNINISALVNDTVGTLVARSYEDPDCDIGVIIGTGTNACYPEKMSGIKKWRGPKTRSGRMIINIEWGNFDRLAPTPYDRQLDGESDNPGQQILEKMVSGMYLGEIARLILKKMAEEGALSCGLIPLLRNKKSFETEHMSVIEADKTSDLKTTEDLLSKLGSPVVSVSDRRVFKEVCRLVSRRGARISASCIAAIITRIDPSLSKTHMVAVDGAVFEKHPTFANDMREGLREIFPRKARQVKPVLAKDGSGKGASDNSRGGGGQMKTPPARFSGWRYGSFGIIALFALLLIIKWQRLPVFLDIYYHASSMTGFGDAGGIVLHDFWEHAPAGLPNLYPPLFHLILLGLAKLGLPLLFIIRFVSAVIFPLLLVTILWVVTKLYDDRRAFFTLLAAGLPYTFFLNAITAIPSTIALIIFILIFYAVETRRTVCGILLLGLSFYAHGGIPWLIILTLIFYSIAARKEVKMIAAIIAGGIVLGSPWLIHMAINRNYFSVVSSYINHYFEANILLYIFAAAGAWIVFKKKGRGLFFFAMIIGMAPMLKGYTFRFLCAEGLLPLIFLAGMGLDEACARSAGFLKGKTNPLTHTVLLPWLVFYLVFMSSSFSRFARYDPSSAGALESSIYFNKYMQELFSIVKANTSPDEIIYCNYNYVAGIFYIFTGRATSSAMLNETRPIYNADPAALAGLVIWIKNPEGLFDRELKALVDKLGLVKVAETELAYVYRNPAVVSRKIVSKPALPAGPAFLILAAWVAAIFICITRPDEI